MCIIKVVCYEECETVASKTMYVESWSIPCNMLRGASKDLPEMSPQSI